MSSGSRYLAGSGYRKGVPGGVLNHSRSLFYLGGSPSR